MNVKLFALLALLGIVFVAHQVMADVYNGSVCNDMAESHCNYCCTQNRYRKGKWKKFGGNRKKTCVCVADSGVKDPSHRNDYEPEYTPYQSYDYRDYYPN